jgi:hypothetical protein
MTPILDAPWRKRSLTLKRSSSRILLQFTLDELIPAVFTSDWTIGYDERGDFAIGKRLLGT